MLLLLLSLPLASALTCDGSELLCLSLTSADEVAASGGVLVGGDFDGSGFLPSNTGGIDWSYGAGQGFAEGRMEVEVTGLVPNGEAEDDGGKVSIFELCSDTHGHSDVLGLQKMAPDYHEGNIFRYGLDDDELADNWDAVIITAADMGCLYEIDAWGPSDTHRFELSWSPDQLVLSIDDWTCSSWGVGDAFNAPDKTFTLANRCTHYSNQQAQARFRDLRVWAWGEVDLGDGGSSDGGSSDGGSSDGGSSDGGASDGGSGDGGSGDAGAADGGGDPGACDPAAPIQILALSPTAGTGLEQVFTTTFRHCQGADQLRIVELYLGDEVGASSPHMELSYEAGLLVYEGMGCSPGEARVLEGSRGRLDCAASTVSQGSEELMVRWALGFTQGSFGGAHGVFVDARGGAGAGAGEPALGWTRMGTWTVAEPGGQDSGGGSEVYISDGSCSCGGGLGMGSVLLVLISALACSRRFPAGDSGTGPDGGGGGGAGDGGAGDGGTGYGGAGDGGAGDGGAGDGGAGDGGAIGPGAWSLLAQEVPVASGSMRMSSLAWDPASARFVGVWGSVTDYYHVEAAPISVDAGISVGSTVRVDDGPFDAFEAELAVAPDGRILVAYEDDRDGGGSCCREIYGQLMEVQGGALVSLGADVNLSQNHPIEQYQPALAWEGDGFFLVYADDRERTPGGDERRLYGRPVSRDGVSGTEVQIAGDSMWQVGASIAGSEGAGRLLVVWGDYDPTTEGLDCGYRARVIAPDGSPLSEVITLVRYGELLYDRPAVAWSPERQAWLVAWTQPYGIRGSWLGLDGSLQSTDFPLVESVDGAGAPHLAWSPATGTFLLSWHAWWTTAGYLQELDGDGQPVGEVWPLTPAPPPLGTFYTPLATSPDGRALVLPSLDWARIVGSAWLAGP